MKIDVNEIVKTTGPSEPQIYCYSTPGITYHDGWVKIGYTERDVDVRIKEQTHTANIKAKKEWQGRAVFEGSGGESFTDKPFHSYLRKQGIKNNIENGDDNEWFETTGEASHGHFEDFRCNRGILKNLGVAEYCLRSEQIKAVGDTLDYAKAHEGGEFLWNAKPRFGKTLSVYDFCKKSGAGKVLIVTNRPSIANSWYDDYEKFLGTESGFAFVSETEALREKKLCTTRETYAQHKAESCPKFIEFVSLQDLKGSVYFGGKFDKLSEIAELEWDVLVVDEAHEGVDTFKTDVAFDKIRRKFTLHLSGTPFKALANNKFEEKAIFNWTYADEQKAKEDWNPADGENPYGSLPKLTMLTYRMSDVVREKAEGGIVIDGETHEYAFDLNEFFMTDKKSGKFVHDQAVDAFLNALTMQKKFPFSTEEMRKELKHTFWLLKSVASTKALKKKLGEHPVFKDYKVVLAAGKVRDDDDPDREEKKAFDAVREAVRKHDKTITLSVGQLTTGVTIPEWTAVLMLSNVGSASLYMQAAFRAQNPCLFKEGDEFRRKETAFVFDFDPARTLKLYDEFANDLIRETAAGRGNSEGREGNIRQLLNFMPVYGEDEAGEMIDLDAANVLSIPRVIRAHEVVRHGFMNTLLFDNVRALFRAPAKVREILNKIAPAKKSEVQVNYDEATADRLGLNEAGEVCLNPEYVIGEASGLFGDKIYGEVTNDLNEAAGHNSSHGDEIKKAVNDVTNVFKTKTLPSLLKTAKERYGDSMSEKMVHRIESETVGTVTREITKIASDVKIETAKIELKAKEKAGACATEAEKAIVQKEAEEQKAQLFAKAREALQEKMGQLVRETGAKIVEQAETGIREEERDEKENEMRNHLRGFARTISAFLMAYGDDSTRLDTFEKSIPDAVFKEVTSITKDEFVYLRDEGKVFDVVTFNDSVKEFLSKKKNLANYFDDGQKECIFDYIPPQKTNQIFTPRRVVNEMLDFYEAENPGCFDNPNATFADLYVKSGLFLAEIVKRLYRSEKMKALYPDETERLRHIFEKQIYAEAPSEIILRIVENFLLGFDVGNMITKHNLRVRSC